MRHRSKKSLRLGAYLHPGTVLGVVVGDAVEEVLSADPNIDLNTLTVAVSVPRSGEHTIIAFADTKED